MSDSRGAVNDGYLNHDDPKETDCTLVHDTSDHKRMKSLWGYQSNFRTRSICTSG